MHRRVVTLLLLVAVISLTGNPGVAAASEHDNPTVRLGQAVAHTLPAIALNTLPGFGLGSYLQGDSREALWLTAADAVAVGLVGTGVYWVNQSDNPDEADLGAVVTLLAGYGAYLGARVLSVVVPIAEAAHEGVETASPFAPIFYNLVPGFGIGSFIQGDSRGGAAVALCDIGALGALGVLSFAALGGMEILSTVSGVALYGLYGTARVLGVYMPLTAQRRIAADA